jgi:hypothetical protein
MWGMKKKQKAKKEKLKKKRGKLQYFSNVI